MDISYADGNSFQGHPFYASAFAKEHHNDHMHNSSVYIDTITIQLSVEMTSMLVRCGTMAKSTAIEHIYSMTCST